MRSQATVVICVLVLIVVIVAADLLFFRNHPGERLIANVGIVAAFGAFYWKVLKRP